MKKNSNGFILDKSNLFMLILAIVIIVVTILGIIFYVLYQNTDFGKSKETLFKKYIIQNIDYIDNALDFSKDKEYIGKVINENYNSQTTMTLKIEDEEYKFDIESNNNKSENKFYSDINISCNEHDVTELELLKKDNIYGLRFTDVVKQFVAIKNEKLNDFGSDLGYQNNIDINELKLIDLTDELEFTEEEKNQLLKTYYTLFFQGLNKNNYSSQGGKVITLSNAESVNTKAYLLTLTQNEIDNIEKRILNKLLEDEIILSKLDEMDKKIKEAGVNNISIKNIYKENINSQLDNFEYVGQNDNTYSIAVYVFKGITVRTTIEYKNKKIIIDTSKDENGIKNIKLRYNTKIENEEVIETYDLTKQVKEDGYYVDFIFNNGKNEYNVKRTMENNNINTNIIYKNEDKEMLNILVNRKIDYSTQSIEIEDEDKIVLLNDYSGSDVIAIINNLETRVREYLSGVQEEINSSILQQAINASNNAISIMTEKQQNNENTEITRFNSQFELYKGDSIQSSVVLELINLASQNMKDYKTAGNQIRLYLEEGTINSEKGEEIKALINKKLTYIVSIGYNDNGKIETITLIPNERN